MESIIAKETTNILKRLSPQNQAYFMTLVRVAEIAENGVRNNFIRTSMETITKQNKTI